MGLLSAFAAGCTGAHEERLAPGVSVESELAAGARHRYRFDSPRPTVWVVAAEERGLDLSLVVFDASGAPCAVADRSAGPEGEERLSVVADAGAVHRLEIRSLSGSPGRYRLRLESGEEPSAEDLHRALFNRAFARAEVLAGDEDREARRRSIDPYRGALASARRLGDRVAEAEVQQRLGELHRKVLEDQRRASEHYEAALALYSALGDEDRRTNILVVLGRVYFALGEVERAEECWNQALPSKQRLGDPLGEASVLANLAVAARYLGAGQRALALYDRSLEILAAEGPQPATGEPAGRRRLYLGRAFNNRGRLYLALGEDRQALADFERARAVGEEIGDVELEAIAATAIGKLLHRRGELAAALTALERAALLRTAAGGRRGRAVTLAALGALYADLGEQTRAMRSLEGALAIFRQLEEPRGEAAAMVAVAELEVGAGKPRRAHDLGREAYEIFTRLEDPAGRIAALRSMARAKRRQGRLAEAVTLSEEGLGLMEQVREQALTPDLRASYFADLRRHFDLHVDVLMDLHRRHPAAGFDRRALAASERFRARSLLELIAEQGEALADRAVAPLQARRRDLGESIRLLHSGRVELDPAAVSADQVAALDARLDDMVREHRSLTGRMLAVAPVARAVEAPLLSPSQIQALLAPETALLELYLGAERSYLWVVTERSVASFELPSRAEVERLAREVHHRLRRSHHREYREATRRALLELSRSVLAPAAGALAASRLLIATDGALHYVPFAALPDPAGGGAMLLDRYEVVMVPSASTMAALRRGKDGRTRPLGVVAVVADPVFEPSDPRRSGAGTGEARGIGGVAAVATVGEALPRLRFAAAEAEAVLAMSEPGQRLAALGFEATREAAMDDALGRYRIVHFATHGFVDSERPELSRLVFSLVDRDGSSRDGVLFSFEISQLELTADLVVLSACETALGREIRGEGLVGLTHSFISAGAAQVLVSLWPVDDAATAELMRRFYDGLLGQNLPPAEALRRAQLSVRSVREWEAPYYWAGFVLQGAARDGN